GYSLRGDPHGWAAETISRINGQPAPVLALDVPSGLDATTGRVGVPCVRAALTMTLALPKMGLLVEEAKPFVGALYLADIGVPPGLYERLGLTVGPLFAGAEVLKIS
ncbi:MAG: NAD(P)H-hydrate epimerase, partial [bacterium]